MKLFFVIDETAFYHPHFLSKFIKHTSDRIVGTALVTHIPPKHNIEKYMVKHWYYLKTDELIKLACKKFLYKMLDLTGKPINGKFYSVKSVLKYYNIDYFTVKDNINHKQYIDKIKEKKPDVIVSSNSLIFGKELLDIPKICCINRHSALLPANGGLWPVFQAYRKGEEHTGVSIHTMENKIDKGIVLSYREVPITEGTTIAKLYKQCFDLSADALIEALDKILECNFDNVSLAKETSYYSFPEKKHWKQFREKGGRFV